MVLHSSNQVNHDVDDCCQLFVRVKYVVISQIKELETAISNSIFELMLIKSLAITLLLSVLVPGVGHIYLGVHHPGIMIFLIGVFLRFVTDIFFPFPLDWAIFGIYWGWALIHVYRIYKVISGPVGQAK